MEKRVADRNRPFFSASVTQMRQSFEAHRNDPAVLEPLRDELRRRNTVGGKLLLDEVQERLDELAQVRDELGPAKKGTQQKERQPEPARKPAGPTRRLTPRETAAQKRIAELRLRLLDLTNRNRLLNYKFADRSRRVVRIVDELPDELLQRVDDNKRLTFKPLPEPNETPPDETTEEFLLALEQAKRSDEEYLEAIGKLEAEDVNGEAARKLERALRDRLRIELGLPPRAPREQLSKDEWARRNGIDPSYDLPRANPKGKPKPEHVDNWIQTLLFPDEMERALSGTYDQARSALQETGVNTLYLALGFLEWYEAQASERPMFAPLLLHSVDLERKIVGGKYRYSVGTLDGDTQINITLSERLHKDFHRRLPELDEEETPDAYLKKVEKAIADMPRWRVRRFAVVGHFAFARLVMFNDLADANWPGGIGVISNSVIARIFTGDGAAAGGDGFHPEEYDVDDPAVSAKVPLLITDADSSQFSAIVDVMEGKNLAVKGPPGTGKSQTITNVVAAALAAGKSVLFVAEKMAALNVVKDRLEKAGLGHFCFELHSTKTRKKDVLEALDKRLAIQGRLRRDGDLEAALKELTRTRAQLSDYVLIINRRFGATGRSLHDILWAEQRTRLGHGLPNALDELALAGVKEMTFHDLDELRGRLDILAATYADIEASGGLEGHPWRGVGNAGLDFFERERLVNLATRLRGSTAGLLEVLDQLSTEVNAALSDHVGDAISVAEALSRLPAPAPDVDVELYAALAESSSCQALERFSAHQGEWLDASRRLSDAADDPDEVAARETELSALADLVRGIGADETSLGELGNLAVRTEREAARVGRAIDLGRTLAAVLDVDTEMTPKALRALLDSARHAGDLPPHLRPMRHPRLHDEGAKAVLAAGHERASRLAAKVAPLAERLAFGLDAEPREWRAPAEALRGAGAFSALFSRQVRAAKRKYKGLMRSRRRMSRRAMAADFEALAECAELAKGLASDAALQSVCGPSFRGHETPFEWLIGVNVFALAVKSNFSQADRLHARLRAVLLDGSPDRLEGAAELAGHPDRGLALEVLEECEHRRVADLRQHQAALQDNAIKAAEAGRRAEALGLRLELASARVEDVASAAREREAAEDEIERNDVARRLLARQWHGARTDRAWVVGALAAARAIEDADLPPELRRHLLHRERDRHIERLRGIASALVKALRETAELWEETKKFGHFDETKFLGSPLRESRGAEVAARLDEAIARPEQLATWTGYLAARHDCVHVGLKGLLVAFEGRPLSAPQLTAAVERVFWRSLAREALAEHPAVGRFRGVQIEKARERFRTLDEQIIALQRKTLAAELCRRPIEAGYRGVSRKEDTGLVLIQREIEKQKRHIPIRDLLDRAGLAVRQMKPCFMMSPLSVAQFLKPGLFQFDLVVIDEASQMRPEEALGAVARGGQTVVVGDPMQLPPTSFFDRVDRVVDDDVDEEELIDNESILDLALTEFRPARDLRWHYRSRHESLIAFSNRHFYEDSLIVFPSPLDPERHQRDPRLGVYHHFVGGTYKGHVNIVESFKVAEAAVAFMAAEPDKSLGIVTLNQAQRDILMEELDRLVPREPAAARYVERWENTLEPFFVKNLENVQGDERDIIFISTVYGPDAATGVVMNRFGPINGVYGHRRLNVLFTRAKDRVEVFTSMRPLDIKAGEGSQPGVHALRAYLEYAETGRLEIGEATGRETESEFERLVRARLVEKGFDVTPQVGVAGYFIDLAVRHPRRSGYLLGIECDGATYHSARSARDRDRLRQQVLERLEWKIYRIWSTDWFHNPDGEMQRLLAHMQRLLRT